MSKVQTKTMKAIIRSTTAIRSFIRSNHVLSNAKRFHFRLTNKMVSDVAHSQSQRVSAAFSHAMLDTIVLDDAAAPHLSGP
jgi:hypothetical protein